VDTLFIYKVDIKDGMTSVVKAHNVVHAMRLLGYDLEKEDVPYFTCKKIGVVTADLEQTQGEVLTWAP